MCVSGSENGAERAENRLERSGECSSKTHMELEWKVVGAGTEQ